MQPHSTCREKIRVMHMYSNNAATEEADSDRTNVSNSAAGHRFQVSGINSRNNLSCIQGPLPPLPHSVPQHLMENVSHVHLWTKVLSYTC